jgi:hypothetical protein
MLLLLRCAPPPFAIAERDDRGRHSRSLVMRCYRTAFFVARVTIRSVACFARYLRGMRFERRWRRCGRVVDAAAWLPTWQHPD